MFSAISQKTGLSNVTPILGTSDNGNGTNLAIIGFNSEPDKKAVSTAASFANSSYRLFSTEMNNLNKRMGDIRDSGEAGVWGRYILRRTDDWKYRGKSTSLLFRKDFSGSKQRSMPD